MPTHILQKHLRALPKKFLNTFYTSVKTDRKCLLQFLATFTKLQNVFVNVRPHVTAQLPLDRFSLNLILEYFSSICQENSSFIKIGIE